MGDKIWLEVKAWSDWPVRGTQGWAATGLPSSTTSSSPCIPYSPHTCQLWLWLPFPPSFPQNVLYLPLCEAHSYLLIGLFMSAPNLPSSWNRSANTQTSPCGPGEPRRLGPLGLTFFGADALADWFRLEVVIVPLATSIDESGARLSFLIIPPASKVGQAGANFLWQTAYVCKEITE